MEHITLPVFNNDGTLAVTREVLEVEREASGDVRLLHSPALVEGVARGDVVREDQAVPCGYRIVRRGGYVAVVLFLRDMEAKRAAERSLGLEVQSIGGICEGGPQHALVFSLPIAAGFPAIEGCFQAAAERFEAKWQFGNVYGPDGSPLNWWST